MLTDKEYELISMEESDIDQTIRTINTKKWLLSALKYSGLNYVYSTGVLKDLLTNSSNKMFVVKDGTSGDMDAVIGLRNIDLIQKRADLILLHDKSTDKKLYGPIKKLLEKATTEWNLNTITTVLYADNVYHRPMLKGFGFTSAGVIKEYTEYEDELYDIEIFSLQKKYFNSIKS